MSIASTTRTARARIASPRRRRHRLALILTAVLVAIVGQLSFAGTAGATAVQHGQQSQHTQDTQHPIVTVGSGRVTGELPFCFNGSPGPCGWTVEGRLTGTPIRSGTFSVAIDHGRHATPRRCVDAFATGILRASVEDEIAHTAQGKLCADGHGGYVFAGRAEIGSGFGRFADISGGRGRVLVTLPARGATTFTLAGSFRTG